MKEMESFCCLLVGMRLGAAPLVPCPDCGAQVSSRAVWCPACGCPGQAIAEAAKAALEARRPKPPAETLVGHSDRGDFTVWPFRVGERCLLLADLADVEAVRTLLVSNTLHGVAVDYHAPALAETSPVVAFETSCATNIHFRTGALAIPVHHGGTARTVTISAETPFAPITPKTLRRQGEAWRAGDRAPKTYTHPFYRNLLKSQSEGLDHD